MRPQQPVCIYLSFQICDLLYLCTFSVAVAFSGGLQKSSGMWMLFRLSCLILVCTMSGGWSPSFLLHTLFARYTDFSSSLLLDTLRFQHSFSHSSPFWPVGASRQVSIVRFLARRQCIGVGGFEAFVPGSVPGVWRRWRVRIPTDCWGGRSGCFCCSFGSDRRVDSSARIHGGAFSVVFPLLLRKLRENLRNVFKCPS